MTNLNLPYIFVPLAAIAMTYLFLHVQKNKIVQIR